MTSHILEAETARAEAAARQVRERDARIAVLEAENAGLRSYVPRLRKSLTRALGIIVEFGDLNGFRNCSDQELGQLVISVAEECGNLLNETEHLAGAQPSAAAAYHTHSEGGEALRSQAEANVLAVRSWDSPGFPACVTREMEKIKAARALAHMQVQHGIHVGSILFAAIKSAIAKRHRDNHDTSPPCAAEPDLELSDVKAALETLGAPPSPSALTEAWRTMESAPKDGSLFIAYNSRMDTMAVVGWTAEHDLVDGGTWTDAGGANCGNALSFNAHYFDWWRPRPDTSALSPKGGT